MTLANMTTGAAATSRFVNVSTAAETRSNTTPTKNTRRPSRSRSTVVAAAASKQTKFKTAKIIDVPCTCDQGIDACRNCKADDHPCVCKSILISCEDQPLQLCKAKVHDCLCRVRFDGIFSKNPRVSGVKEDYSCKYIGRTTGAACGICRQHNKTENGRVQTETPAKKKPRLA